MMKKGNKKKSIKMLLKMLLNGDSLLKHHKLFDQEKKIFFRL